MSYMDRNIVPADDGALTDAYSQAIAGAVDLVGPAVSRIEQLGARAGHGSGFAISPDGLIVTNNHVVGDAHGVRITTPDGFVTEGRVLGRDVDTDIALIRANSSVGAWAKLGDSKRLRRGHIAIRHRQSTRLRVDGDGWHRLGTWPQHARCERTADG
jgi:S1-C subfamily serine protease